MSTLLCVYFLHFSGTGGFVKGIWFSSSCCQSVAAQLTLTSEGWVTRMCKIVPVCFSMSVGPFVSKISSINLTFVIYDVYSSPNFIGVMKARRMRRAGYIAHMGDRGGTNGFWWKNLVYRDQLEDLRLHSRMKLKWIFRLIQIIHMASRQQSGKN